MLLWPPPESCFGFLAHLTERWLCCYKMILDGCIRGNPRYIHDSCTFFSHCFIFLVNYIDKAVKQGYFYVFLCSANMLNS